MFKNKIKKKCIWQRRHDIQHNNTKHYELICDTQHNDIQHNDTQLKGLNCGTQH